MTSATTVFSALLLAGVTVSPLYAQTAAASKACADIQMTDHNVADHDLHTRLLEECNAAQPKQAGNDAFAAIGEIVRTLKADPKTDWSKVNIEGLRQHLIDMQNVTLRSSVASRPIPQGVALTITGEGPTVAAIRRMVPNHARMLATGEDYKASVTVLPDGVLLNVTSAKGDARTVDMIRALGFAGLLTEGNHHAPHHLALARGDSDPHAAAAHK